MIRLLVVTHTILAVLVLINILAGIILWLTGELLKEDKIALSYLFVFFLVVFSASALTVVGLTWGSQWIIKN